MATSDSSIRQFQAEVPEAELTEMRRRINATRWPERETVSDDSQGVRLAMMQELQRGPLGQLFTPLRLVTIAAATACCPAALDGSGQRRHRRHGLPAPGRARYQGGDARCWDYGTHHINFG